jgi:hypothetical protein
MLTLVVVTSLSSVRKLSQKSEVVNAKEMASQNAHSKVTRNHSSPCFLILHWIVSGTVVAF